MLAAAILTPHGDAPPVPSRNLCPRLSLLMQLDQCKFASPPQPLHRTLHRNSLTGRKEILQFLTISGCQFVGGFFSIIEL
jgi:hypothetical protein